MLSYDDEDGAFLEIALIPLSPELEALPDAEGFASVGSKIGPTWIPIRGKAVDIEGFPTILHAGSPANEGEWRVSEIQCGYELVRDDDPVQAVKRAREKVRRVGVEPLQQKIESLLERLPPKPMAQGSEQVGFFFCCNCGRVDKENVPYKKREDNCTHCGFCDWIWEPKDA